MSARCEFPGGERLEVRAGETLLEAARRSAVAVPFSCGAGICHSCLLKAVAGAVPPAAQKGLAPELKRQGYLLACQCEPVEPLVLRHPDPADQRVDALLHDAEAAGDFIHVRLETARQIPCRPGERLELLAPGIGEVLYLDVTAVRPVEFALEGLCQPAAGLLGLEFGSALKVRGPVASMDSGADEQGPPRPDPALWEELGNGRAVRAVLEDFYGQVYEDPRLAPFFTRVTRDRSIDKQYSFLRQLMTGERTYFGDRPRNAHHWMVIPHELFDHRQSLMQATLAAHGVSATQAARWNRLELHYRSDIVKSAPWPRRVDGCDLPLDGYSQEVLGEASVCDHCGGEVSAGTPVHYHRRLGTINCPQCTGEEALGDV